MTIHGTAREGGEPGLFLPIISSRLREFTHLLGVLHLQWLSSIFNHSAITKCNFIEH